MISRPGGISRRPDPEPTTTYVMLKRRPLLPSVEEAPLLTAEEWATPGRSLMPQPVPTPFTQLMTSMTEALKLACKRLTEASMLTGLRRLEFVTTLTSQPVNAPILATFTW